MGKLQREGIWNTFISYAGIGIGYVNTVLLFPNFLAEDEVGLTRLLTSLALMYAQFSALGFNSMSARYFPYFRDKAKAHHGFLFLLLAIPVAGFAVISALFLLTKPLVVAAYEDSSRLLLDFYFYIIPLAFFTLLLNLLTSYLRSLYKTIVSSFVQDFLLKLLTSVLILVYSLGFMSFQDFVIAYIGINSIVLLVLAAYTMWLRQLFLKPSWEMLRIIPLGELLHYGFFTFLGTISTTIITTIDQFMIGSYSLSDNGVYTTAFFMTTAIMIPAKSVLKIAYPQVADYWKDKNMDGIATLYKQITLVNLILGLLLSIGIWANIDNLFSFMPEPYRAGKYVVLFMSVARLVDLATGINGIILATSDKYRWDLVFNVVLAVLTVWTNFYFIPLYGINGAAFASMLSYASINLARLFFLHYLYRMQPFAWSSLTMAIIAATALGASYLLPYLGNVYLDMVVRSLLISVIYASLTLGLRVFPEMNAWLLSYIGKLLKR
ncbi:oligosaccharide flippase family protein [Pontibacter qinzhouensis]|uniref:Oligosaccharide flippase family protein n=1 Tax=Pontibacter qinzhouensis TaxID=2603253 RepID=A0A5C8K4S6_9BACT|nr:polysaccharide biosynthesis C-terminal domain-containing protein [Pontibacter qinzhouensis]TXK44871.1 oligosaccharide flippase family protein [Pontibacter qinzhouensis]